MIHTGFESRVKIQDVIVNHLPEFILDESPKVVDFLKQYYISQEYQGGPVDIAENLDQYLKVDNLTSDIIVDTSVLTSFVESPEIDAETGYPNQTPIINVSSTKGFPDRYGLLKIDDEIITYTEKTSTSFVNCIRGFSGITSYHDDLNDEELVFSSSSVQSHNVGTTVQNLSSLFLKEFYKKIKYTFTPGFENRSLTPELNVGNFIKEARSFYASKGTDESFRILFNVLYGETPRVINLEENLIKLSSSEFIRREIVVAESITGNPSNLVGQTIFKTNDPSTSASISEVEAFTRKGVLYHKISLFVGYNDNSAIEGTFKITPSTKCLEKTEPGSLVLSVDSTIGFPQSGVIISGDNVISYTDKSVNQFFGCTGIERVINPTDNVYSSDETYYGYENGDINKKVQLRLTGVLSNFKQKSNFISVNEGQILTVKSIGDRIENFGPGEEKTYKQIFANSWIYNTSSSIEIESFIGNGVVLKTDIDKSQLKKGDKIEIIDKSTDQVVYPTDTTNLPFVKDFISFNSRTVILENFAFNGNPDNLYSLRRKINKSRSESVEFKYGNDTIISDVLNVYSDDEFCYVASNSIPSAGAGFTDFKYNIKKSLNESILNPSVGLGQLTNFVYSGYDTFSFNEPVQFITGDKIYYSPSDGIPLVGLDTGYYYVEVLPDPKNIRLYRSPSSLVDASNAIQVDYELEGSNSHIFTLHNQHNRLIDSEKILKKFSLSPNIKNGNGTKTIPGSLGMLINGVEIFNYKTYDKVYYGPIEKVEVLNGGKDFDVVNPPKIVVSSGIGTTALVQPALSGTITEMYVDLQNFDIQNVLSINVSGGNISGGIFEPVLIERKREILVDARATTDGGGISTTTSQLTFLSNHNLKNGEEVFYNNNGNPNISIGIGLSSLINLSSYFVSVDNNTTIKLFKTYDDYLSNNPIGFAATSLSGTHKFLIEELRKTISEIKIIDGGKVTNRRLLVKPSGISTVNNMITFENHGFSNGDVVNYSFTNTPISGLSTANQYYILLNDKDSFRLCDAGIGATIRTNFEQEKIVKFSSTGSGYQEFKYPDIVANVSFTPVSIGATAQTQIVEATPIIKGEIVDLLLYENGTGYGSTILNSEQKPIFTIKNGKEAQAEPIIVNGSISDINLQFGGYEYYSIPNLEVFDPTGSGTGAKLRAIISNGEVTDITIVNSGIGYSTSSKINIIPSGSGAVFDSSIRSLSVNNVEKYPSKEYETFRDNENGVQYFVSAYSDEIQKTLGDYGNSFSKIIGWSYDGNPIYGSFGYADPSDSNSGIKTLRSGYSKSLSNIFDRPTEFNLGFFIEDYKFDNSGDLDSNNGIFSKTPDFPDGIYSYYATIDPETRVPEFPYFIGDSYRSNLLSENENLDQYFDFNSSSLVRNTYPYKISEVFADNDFIIESNEIKNQRIEVESISDGPITELNIINPGDNYKVADSLIFDNDNTGGGGILAKVSSIEGRTINQIETTIESFEDSTFVWEKSKVRGYILPYHNLSNSDYITISGFSTSVLSKLNNYFRISVEPDVVVGLTTEIVGSGSTTSEIYLTNVPSTISVGNSIGIGTEILQVIGVYSNKNILRVKRGLPGISHTISEPVVVKKNSFLLDVDIDYFESKLNEKVYFNPKESVGVGTISGTGFSTSFSFGNEVITRDIPTQRIYIENHPFFTNQRVTLNLNGNSSFSISTSSTGTPFNIPQTLYVVNKSPNTIGIKTGIGTNFSEVYFIDNGENKDDYFLETNYKEEKGDISKITSLLSISTSHGLTTGDTINLSIKPNLSVGIGTSNSVRVLYKSQIDNLIVNPIQFSSSSISTVTNQISIENHQFSTGDKVFYDPNGFISGISTGSYFVYKVDESNIKLSETYKNITKNPPIVVDFATSGGPSQIISKINPQIFVTKNNSLVFNLSDSSLSGYELKIYYDQDFKNEFVSTGSTSIFNISGVGTLGISTNASLTIDFNSNFPNKLYYTLEKNGDKISNDIDVKNYSEIIYVDSVYSGKYNVFDVENTSFKVSLSKYPEKLLYASSDCDELKYTSSSTSVKGPVNKINLISGGTDYKKIPPLVGTDSVDGKNLNVSAKSDNVGNIKDVRIINQGFEYSSDRTLEPQAFISPKLTLRDSNTIESVEVVNGGQNFISAPEIVVVNNNTREAVTNGLLVPSLVGNSISNVSIEVAPKGICDQSAELFTIKNTNGVSIKSVQSSSSGIFTCFITTPTDGFSIYPFSAGDKVFIEGIQKFSDDGSGFNSEDYGYKFFSVVNYDTSTADNSVTIDITDYTSNTGIAKTIQDSSGIIVNRNVYPTFDIELKPSFFTTGEDLLIDNDQIGLRVVEHSAEVSLKVIGTYELSKNEVISGKSSGTIAIIDTIENYYGNFDVDFSSRKEEGWKDQIGRLSEDYQVLPDNDYYQNLSYSIKSNQQWKDIRTPVNSLVHSVGLKNFSDTQIKSSPEGKIGVTTTANQTTIIKDIIEENRVDTINNFDFVKDADVVNDVSRFVSLQNKRLTNYTEVGTNIVLRVDDISDKFSNFDGEPNEFVDILEINTSDPYLNYLIKVNSLDGGQIQLTNVVIINDDFTNDSYILEKQNLSNVGIGLTIQIDDQHGDFLIGSDEFGTNYLRFSPNDPFNTEYDIKYIERKFVSDVGIGTTTVGFIDLISTRQEALSGVTTSIIQVSTSDISSVYVSANIIQDNTNIINFVELYVTHDGVNTNISEYYFDTDSEYVGSSFSRIGTGFTSFIESGLLSLEYINDTALDISINVKIISFGTPGGLGVGGTYRFLADDQPDNSERSAIYQSTYSTTNSGLSTTVFTLDKNLFDSVNSLVEVSMGSTKSTHQLFLVQDGDSIYTQQYSILSIGNTLGIGTFGGEYSGLNNFELKFYPDSNLTGNISILALNECLYSTVDFSNEYNDLTYGPFNEKVGTSAYFAINGDRTNRKNFTLTSNGIPIFSKTFNPSNSNVLNLSSGVFSIENHFFSNGEELIYSPGSSFIGVGATPILYNNGVFVSKLPSTVFAVVGSANTNNFQISTTRYGNPVTFTSFGEGNSHKFTMVKRNEKSLITIDNIAQYPISFSKITKNLSGNGGGITTTSNIFSLSGITTIYPLDILKIDNEYMNVINVGLGTTNVGPITNVGTQNLVEVERGFVGSAATSHSDGTLVGVYKGSYNITNNEIFFTRAPRGYPVITRNENNLKEETSDFTGRVFLRSNYDTNQIYDDISDQFTGIGRTFTLTVGGANTIGIGTTGGNGVVFINGIFQTPTTANNPDNNFIIVENSSSGISSIVFSGIRTDIDNPNSVLAVTNDINQNQVPRGGIIVSLGSSGGLGYSPLVGASVTAVISGGVIQNSIGIGTTDNVGSGYNNIVSIGVSAYDPAGTGSGAVIAASVGVGGTLSFNVTNGGSGYSNQTRIYVSEPSYENLQVVGVSRLGVGSTTDTGVGLLLNVEVGASSTTGIGSTYFEVTNFSISRTGYSFRRGDVFKPVGLVTDKRLSSPLSEFTLTVLDTFSDSFAAWQFGELDFIDSIKNYQDGTRLTFPLFYNGSLLSFESPEDSDIELANSLIIFINGVLQDPSTSYTFNGGTSFTFADAPKPEDEISVFFYRGTRGLDDTLVTNVLPTLERGDIIQIFKNNTIPNTTTQDKRTVFDLSFSDKFETNPYFAQGVDTDNEKPMSWTKQKTDRIINGQFVYKTRQSILSQIYPTAKVIDSISASSNQIFVDDGDLFEYDTAEPFSAILVDGKNTSTGIITATVGVGGTISSVTILNSGSGYIGSTVDVKFMPPPVIGVGIGTTAEATININSNGSLSTPIITNPGFGYSSVPKVIIPSPDPNIEYVTSITSVKGFSGIITGIGVTINGGQLALKFNLKTTGQFDNGTNSLLQGYPIFIKNTNVGSGVISVDSGNSNIVGIGTTFLDNIYYVHQVSHDGTVNGIVTCNVHSSTAVSALPVSGNNIGQFSWGLLGVSQRSSAPISIAVTGKTVDVGLSTFPTIQRRSQGIRQTGSIDAKL